MTAKEDVLASAISDLEQALAGSTPGRESGWADRAGGALAGVEQALQRHVKETDAAGGMFSRVDLKRPTLVRKVGELRQEHADFLGRLGALRQEVRQAGQGFQAPAADGGVTPRLPEPAAKPPVPDFGDLRRRLEDLLAALKRHRDDEAGLLLESVNTDIGAGD